MEKEFNETKLEQSPVKQPATDSIKKSNVNSSPVRQGPLSDFSPLKGPTSIASFFAPPPMSSKSSSPVAGSPQKSAPISPKKVPVYSPQKSSINSPHRIAPVTPSKLTATPLKSQMEDSESDLTLSEGDNEEEQGKVSSMKTNKNDVSVIGETSSTIRTIPSNFKYEDSSESEVEEDDSKNVPIPHAEEVSSDYDEEEEKSDSDISVIISLPSTDSNEGEVKPVIRRYVDFSNSEYEEDENETENEEDDIPVDIESDAENDNQIPVMVFRSNQISVPKSPENNEKKRTLPVTETRRPPSPKKVEIEIDPFKAQIPAPKTSAEVQINRGHQEIQDRKVNFSINNTYSTTTATTTTTAPAMTHNNQPQHPIIVRQSSPRKRANSIEIIQNAVKQSVNRIPLPAHVNKVNPVIAPAPVPVARLALDNFSNGAMISNVAPQPPVNNVIKCRTGYVYDDRMLHHFDPHDLEHPEKPARIASIYEKLRSAKLLERSHRIMFQVKLAEFAIELQSVHDPKYCRMINQTSVIRNMDELSQISSRFNSVYLNSSTAISATVAAAATVELCQSIGRGEIENGFAIVRPPGHHAEHDEAMGFCIYNNCAIAASSLLRKNLARRVMILDWDVHHGNGTQNAFAENGDVLYVSLHRYDGGKFYPHIEEANHTYVGTGAGIGKSVNVAWNGPGFGDADYMYAFSRLIMPIAREFNPDFVIVSAGFDAAAGDPIGECELTTFGYSMMLQELMTLAGGKVALVLEGGYNLEVISKCYEACVKMLLKEPPPRSETPMIASPRAVAAVENSVISLSPYWKCLFPKPAHLSINENTPQFPLPVILDHFWREECRKHFNLSPIPGIFKNCSDSFIQKYSNRILVSEGAMFTPEVLIVFAHESGPIYSNNFLSSLCLQPSKINQSQPFLPLLQAAHQQANYSFIDINLPPRMWKLKQTALGNEAESQELNVLFTLLWDRLIARSGCRNVFFIAAGSPIYSIGHLINTRDLESQVRGCFFFSSTLFIPVINSTPSRAEWYQRNSQVIVPSQDPIKKAINNAAASFGSCYSAGQWLMADSAAAVGDYKMDILNFIRTRLQR